MAFGPRLCEYIDFSRSVTFFALVGFKDQGREGVWKPLPFQMPTDDSVSMRLLWNEKLGTMPSLLAISPWFYFGLLICANFQGDFEGLMGSNLEDP